MSVVFKKIKGKDYRIQYRHVSINKSWVNVYMYLILLYGP